MALETSTTTADGVARLLAEPRFELMPFDSFGEQMEGLPDGSTITVTASPQLGVEATVEWTERGAKAGYEMVPHVAARYVRDADHLTEIADRLRAVGVEDVFVPGGDREEPIGEYESAHDLLVALAELGYEFEEVGITGYPEGHQFLSDRTLAREMERKAPYSTYVATQICYDPARILEWCLELRERGIELPVEIGVPGVMKYQRLIGISRKVGVGDSVNFLRKTGGVFGFIREFLGFPGHLRPRQPHRGAGPVRRRPRVRDPWHPPLHVQPGTRHGGVAAVGSR